MNEDVIKTLNDLIHLDTDAMHAYLQAIDACEIAEVKENLSSFKEDHERHVSELAGAVRALGGTPVEGRDLKGFFIEGFTAVASVGDKSALLAMRGNEEITTRRYDAARNSNLPAQVRTLVDNNHADEVRHLDWIKRAIDRQVWLRKGTRAA